MTRVFRNKAGRLVEQNGYAGRLYWGEQKVSDFKRLYPVTRNEDLAIRFGCCKRTVARRAQEMGLRKSEAWMHEMNVKNLHLAITMQKIYGRKDMKEHNPMRSFTPERRSEIVLKGWETRRRNKGL